MSNDIKVKNDFSGKETLEKLECVSIIFSVECRPLSVVERSDRRLFSSLYTELNFVLITLLYA